MGPDFGPKMAVKSLTSQQIVRIHQLFRQAKFDDPSGDVSSLSVVLTDSFYFYFYFSVFQVVLFLFTHLFLHSPYAIIFLVWHIA